MKWAVLFWEYFSVIHPEQLSMLIWCSKLIGRETTLEGLWHLLWTRVSQNPCGDPNHFFIINGVCLFCVYSNWWTFSERSSRMWRFHGDHKIVLLQSYGYNALLCWSYRMQGEGMGKERSYNAMCLLRIIIKEMELKLNSVIKVFMSYATSEER